MHLTQDLLMELLEYQPDTGKFFWRTPGVGKRRAEAGNFSGDYVRIGIKGKVYYAHRLAFLYMTGKMPDVVDHKDGDTRNCKWSNLRESTHSDNGKNTTHRGYHRTSSGRFAVQITTDYKTQHIGTYDTPEEARRVYEQAKSKTHAPWATGQGPVQSQHQGLAN